MENIITDVLHDVSDHHSLNYVSNQGQTNDFLKIGSFIGKLFLGSHSKQASKEFPFNRRHLAIK